MENYKYFIKRSLAMALALIMIFTTGMGGFSSEAEAADQQPWNNVLWESNTSSTQSNTAITIAVGDSVTLEGKTNYKYNEWTSSDENVATVSNNGTVTGMAASGDTPVTITHKYKSHNSDSWMTETFTVTVTGGTPVVSVNSVNIEEETATVYVGVKGTPLTVTVDPADAEVSWSSSDTSIATVDSSGVVTGVKAGTATATITATAGDKSDTCTVTVSNTSDVTLVYVYLNSSNLSDYNFPNLTKNSSGWYTVGYIAVPSTEITNYTTSSTYSMTDVTRGLLSSIIRYSNNTGIPTSFLINTVSEYHLFESNQGATDYVTDTGTYAYQHAYHFDLYAPAASTTYAVTVNYVNEANNSIIKSKTVNAYTYGASVDASYYREEKISGYTFDYADPTSITVDSDTSKNVLNLYYKPNGSIVVSLDNKEVTYNGTEQTLTSADVKITGGPSNITPADLNVRIFGGNGTNAGTYPGSITGDASTVINGGYL